MTKITECQEQSQADECHNFESVRSIMPRVLDLISQWERARDMRATLEPEVDMPFDQIRSLKLDVAIAQEEFAADGIIDHFEQERDVEKERKG